MQGEEKRRERKRGKEIKGRMSCTLLGNLKKISVFSEILCVHFGDYQNPKKFKSSLEIFTHTVTI